MNGKAPGRNTLERWCAEGLTQQQMVERWEKMTHIRVARSTIAMALERHGLSTIRPNPHYPETSPWRVAKRHQMSWDARMLRLVARAGRRQELRAVELRDLANWRANLAEADLVVTYEPKVGFIRVPAGYDTPSTAIDPRDFDEPPF